MTCKAFVYIYSPHYFASEYCGKEYEVFRQRLNDHAKKNKSKGLENRLLLPVLWVPPTDVKKPPAVVTEHQYFNDLLGNDYKKNGLMFMSKQKGTYPSAYNKFLWEFSSAMLQAVKDAPLAQATSIPELRDVTSAWMAADPAPPVNSPESPDNILIRPIAALPPAPASPLSLIPAGLPSQPPPYARGLNHALIYYAAAFPPNFAGKRSQERLPFYKDYGGAEWLPFPPPPPPEEQAALIAQQSVDEAKLGTVVHHLFVDDLLPEEVRKAEEKNTIVILIVDPCSLRVETLFKVLNKCDEDLRMNWAVLVPWNRSDPDVNGSYDELLALVEQAFKRHVTYTMPNLVHKSIDSRDALKKGLVDAILGTKGRISANSTNYRKAEPSPAAPGMAAARPLTTAGADAPATTAEPAAPGMAADRPLPTAGPGATATTVEPAPSSGVARRTGMAALNAISI